MYVYVYIHAYSYWASTYRILLVNIHGSDSRHVVQYLIYTLRTISI